MTGRSREPRAIGAELADVLRARGWDGRLAAARVVARWPEVVGDAVAAHCQPSRLDEDGTLQVVADSAAWATQLTYLQGKLLDRLAAECGPGLVRRSRSAPTKAAPADDHLTRCRRHCRAALTGAPATAGTLRGNPRR